MNKTAICGATLFSVWAMSWGGASVATGQTLTIAPSALSPAQRSISARQTVKIAPGALSAAHKNLSSHPLKVKPKWSKIRNAQLQHHINPAFTPRLNPNVLCPDPAVVRLTAHIIRRDSSAPHTRGEVEIDGIVKNLGGYYRSNPNQQAVDLYDGAGLHAMVVHRIFVNLAHGQQIAVRYRTSWDVSREFQANYRMMIVYDPDIRADSNKRNDDCRLGDNSKTLRASTISALFTRR